MLVTIISDASHCSRTNAAGYGYWIKSGRGSHGGGGSFKGPLRDALEAETMAIVNAIHLAIALQLALPADSLLVQTDCMGAIACLERTMRKGPRDALLTARDRYDELRSKYQLKVTFRHVKGHSKVQDNRSRAQRMADLNAKIGMRKKRKELTPVNPPTTDALSGPERT